MSDREEEIQTEDGASIVDAEGSLPKDSGEGEDGLEADVPDGDGVEDDLQAAASEKLEAALPTTISAAFKEEEKEVKREVTTYRLRPTLPELFQPSQIKCIIQNILADNLSGKVYNSTDAGKWTREIADQVSASMKDQVEMPRYKHVVQVTLGQQLGAGCRYVAKCCWDAEADSQVSDVFSSPTLFCVCTVFGIYLY